MFPFSNGDFETILVQKTLIWSISKTIETHFKKYRIIDWNQTFSLDTTH